MTNSLDLLSHASCVTVSEESTNTRYKSILEDYLEF